MGEDGSGSRKKVLARFHLASCPRLLFVNSPGRSVSPSYEMYIGGEMVKFVGDMTVPTKYV